MLPFLEEIKRRGIGAFVDCTPAFIGRDVEILRRLSERTGIHILTNTGYYGAAGDKFVPAHAREESAEELAARWAAEWRDGIEGTGVRPGFIKTGVDKGPLSRIDRTLVRAAALTHLRTGLTIACHTGEAVAALEALDVVQEAGAAPDALIVVHADGIMDETVHERLARAGAWVEFDGVGPATTSRHVGIILNMVDKGCIGRLLLSHDAGWYRVGEPRGGTVRPFTAISDLLIPALREAMRGRTPSAEQVIRQVMADNPACAFQVSVRRTGGR